MTTPPIAEPREVTDEEWKRLKRLLDEIFNLCLSAFFPLPVTVRSPTDPMWHTHEVAMSMFIHYFDTLPLAYEEQLHERLKTWFGPFDDIISQRTGIHVTRFAAMVGWIESEFQAELDRLRELKQKFNEQREDLLKLVKGQHVAFDEFLGAANQHPIAATTLELKRCLDRLYQIDRPRMAEAFSQADVAAFVDQFAMHRGQYQNYFFPTEKNPAASRPIFVLDDGALFCPAPSQLWYAALREWESLLRSSERNERYLRNRDRALEEETRGLFAGFFGPSEARIWSNVYETANGQGEHDLLIETDGIYLVVECKASPPKEPFRDPQKAYIRIRSDFRSGGGIQKAYEQANHLRRMLLTPRETTLYDRDGNPLVRISGPAREALCVCVTADSFGALAVDLSLLLEKDPADPYPWAVAVYDLETMLSGFAHERKTKTDLLSYLRQRAGLHGRLFSSDELEVAGMYLRYGELEKYAQSDARMFLTPEMSDIFDEIYFEKHGIPRPPAGTAGEAPFAANVGEWLRRTAAKNAQPPRARKVGRNDPCPCGSGLKYKKCHGR